MTLKMRLLGGLVAVSMLFAGCAQGVDDETFTAGVTGVELESPAADSFTYSIVTDATGTEQVKIQWPTVMGAGGYLCSVWNVNDPANPEVLVDNETVDGAAVYFPLAEDSNYKISVQTLGNEKLNNTGAAVAAEYYMNTMIEGIAVPTTADLGEFITNYITEHADELAAERAANPNFEIAFDLEAGANYTMATIADFGTQATRVRGDRQNKPTVTIAEGSNAYFMTAGGLKLKFLNIDANGMDAQEYAVIVMHTAPPADTKIGPRGYVCEKPIRIESCWLKNVRRSILSFGNKEQWGVYEFRISDCLIHLNNTGSGAHKTLIYGYSGGKADLSGGWYGGIRDTYVVNSTIYNAVPDASIKNSAYFIRFSNGDIAKVFGSNGGKFNLQNCTLSRVWPNKDFGNNIGNKNYFTCNFENNIFYDTRLVQKILGRGCVVNVLNNIMWCPTKGVDNTDKTKYVTEQDPGFTSEQVFQELDFSKPNGGLNFTPTVNSGDPRWLK